MQYRCPNLCSTPLSAEFLCPTCNTSFPHTSVGSTMVVDFLLATRPAGECRCPRDQAATPCHVFLDKLKVPAEPKRASHYKAKLLRLLERCQGKVILDVGCREAPIGHLLADRNYMVGVDRCPQQMLAETPNALDKGYRELWLADAARLPLQDGQADMVIATDLLEHVVTPELLLREFHRVLKPSGGLLVTVPNLVSYNNRLSILVGSGIGVELHLLLKGRSPVNPIAGARYPDQTQHLRFFTLASLNKTLATCGFTVEHLWGYDPLLSRIPLADRLLRNLCLLAAVYAVKR